MAGEENAITTVRPDTSVPIVGDPNASGDCIATFAAPPLKPLLPYDTSTRWRPWPAFGVVMLIIVASTGIALAGTFLLLKSGGSSAQFNPASGRSLLAMLAAQMTMIVGALWAARAKSESLTEALALKPPAGGFATYAKALAALLAAVGLYTGVTYLLDHDPSSDMAEMMSIIRGPWWPVALVVIGLGAPLSEELLFRGFLQTALVPTRLGYWGAAIVTTTIWTALHAGYSIFGLVEVYMVGLIFALYLRVTGSLRVTLVCHAIYNTIVALFMIFAPKEWLGL